MVTQGGSDAGGSGRPQDGDHEVTQGLRTQRIKDFLRQHFETWAPARPYSSTSGRFSEWNRTPGTEKRKKEVPQHYGTVGHLWRAFPGAHRAAATSPIMISVGRKRDAHARFKAY